jgi:tripartite ATP-independent transporter DctM subunit
MEIVILILSFVVLLSLGVPIAYSIGLAATFTLLAGMSADGMGPLISMTTSAQRMASGLDSFTLLAIPFFILAGNLMNRGGIAERLINFAKSMVGMLPGGLAFVNIIAAMLMGAISGSAVAAASAIGGFMHTRMRDEGYDEGYSAAVNITASTTGLIIPPSNVLIVYSLASGGASIAALFVAGYLPGLLVGLCLMVVGGVIAKRRNYPKDASFDFRRVLSTGRKAFFSLLLLVVVIGGIVKGIFTATEASAIAVVYTLALGLAYREIKWRDLPGILLNTSGTTAIVLMLIATSTALSWTLSFENIPQDVTTTLLALTDNKVVLLLLINLILLIVGVFMDMTPAVLIFTPIFLPIVMTLGIDPVHFGIIMVLNLCIGLCTPPVGSVLFIGAAVAKLPISRVVRPLLPFFIAMIVALMIVTFWPGLSLWLPGVFGL